MTNIADFLDLDRLATFEAEGLIAVKRNDSGLVLRNYTPKTQYSRAWFPETLACRGLITTEDGEVVARPFPKFFNLEEMDQLPDLPFSVTNKFDGSLIIAFQWQGELVCATRGSFSSEQAIAAREIWDSALPPVGQTWLCEYVGPTNQIVIRYDVERLVLLAVIDNATGMDLECPPDGWNGEFAAALPGFATEQGVKATERPGHEGFVLRYTNGLRVKVKHAEYVRLHRILTCVSSKTIWETLSAGLPLDEMLDHVPDEFYAFVRQTERDLRARHHAIKTAAWTEFADICSFICDGPAFNLPDRKSFAAEACQSPNHALLFQLYDGRDVDPLIWKMIQPAYERPFRQDDAA